MTSSPIWIAPSAESDSASAVGFLRYRWVFYRTQWVCSSTALRHDRTARPETGAPQP